MGKFDVVIVGAGPAGLKAAETLAKAGKKVLVLEKNKVIGPKVCAAGITNKDLEYIPKELVEREFDCFYIIENRRTRIKHKLYTIEREKLGNYQLKLARQAGAIVKTGSFVDKINKNSVTANGAEYFFDYLIGADGSNSIVRKHLKLKNRFMALSMQYKIPELRKDMEVVFNSRKYKSWYAWVFPHKDYTYIGTATLLEFPESKYLRKILDDFAKRQRFSIINAEFEAALINCYYQGYKFGNIFLAGDASGLANPFTGEGIYQAFVSGEEIAKKILDNSYSCPKLKRIIEKNLKLIELLEMLNNVPPLMSFTYWLGFRLIKNRRFQRKLIKTFMEY